MTGTRVLTATVLVPVVVAAVWWGPTWLIALLVAGVIALTLREYFLICEKTQLPGFPVWTIISAAALVYAQFLVIRAVERGIASDNWAFEVRGLRTISPELVLVIFVLGAAGLALGSKRGVTAALPSVGVSAAGFLFIAWPLSLLVRMHGATPALVLLTLSVVWVGDTVAYFVGRGIGRHLLAPAVSPKKTWEGAVGNLIGAAVVGFLFSYAIPGARFYLIDVCLLASVAGQVGDLLESAMKRGAGVKDSGALLPGHGGMWDRIDALILATPVVWWYFYFF